MRADHESEVKMINFLVKDVRMCAYLKDVNKVLPLVELEHVPGAPPYLAGLMNIEGKSIPVIDLAIRSGLSRREKYSLDMPVLLCSNGVEEVAMIVDTIFGLTEMNEKNFQMREEFNKPDSPFVASIVHDSESSLLININYVLGIRLTGE